MATGRPHIIAFQGGFHGRTVAAASITTAGTTFRSGLSPLLPGVHISPFPYALRHGWDDAAVASRLVSSTSCYGSLRVSPPGDERCVPTGEVR